MDKSPSSTANKTVRLVDIAAKAGVSRSAVASVVLKSAGKNVRVSEATAKRIREVAWELGYAPNASAQRLAGKRSMLIGALIDSYAPVQRFSQLAEIERAADAHGYRVMVGQSHGEIDKIRKYASDFIANGVDGAVCISHNYPTIGASVAEAFLQVPNVVFLGPPLKGSEGAWWIAIDHRDAVRQLVTHFYAKGRRRIGICLPGGGYQDVEDRRAGYFDALADCELKRDESLVISGSLVDEYWNSCDPHNPLAVYLAERIRGGELEAILTLNDVMAMSVIRALTRQGLRVPQDVGVSGYDNVAMASVTLPSITTIDLRPSEVAALGFEMLMSRINGKSIPTSAQRRQLKPRLIARESS